jgi:hypothetical protein
VAAGTSSKFQQLALTHAAMMGGEAAMVVALADSFFFDVDPNGARSKVLAFLLVSFAPFLLVAPLIGPLIDRVRGGRRFMVQAVAGARIVVQLLMIRFADDIALFPLVFVALVLQKTYAVSKSALVPAVVRSERELVEANAKLGVIAGVAGTVAVLPAAGLQFLVGSGATLAYGAVLFGVALWAALGLPHELALRPGAPSAASPEAVTTGLQLAWVAMVILRAAVGFMLFHLAFLFRGADDGGKVLLGAAVGLSSIGVMIGNSLAPSLRRWLHEERMITVALALPAAAGLVAAALGGNVAGIAVAFVVNFSAAIGRLSFESIVQRDGPEANRGQAFARFETRFQFGWVIAAVIPVVLEMPGSVGYLLVGCGVARRGGQLRGRRAGGRRRRARRPRGPSVAADASDPEARRLDLARRGQRLREREQPGQVVLAHTVDDALHEVLAARHLVVAQPDAEQALDEHVVRVGLGAAAAHGLGDAERLTAHHAHRDRVDHPVGVAHDGRHGGVETRLERFLLGGADRTEQELRIAEHLLERLGGVVARRERVERAQLVGDRRRIGSEAAHVMAHQVGQRRAQVFDRQDLVPRQLVRDHPTGASRR